MFIEGSITCPPSFKHISAFTTDSLCYYCYIYLFLSHRFASIFYLLICGCQVVDKISSHIFDNVVVAAVLNYDARKRFSATGNTE